ncbi:MAG TPA: hypothetical protein VGC29_10565 [Flavisolibacter sp.]
MAMSTSTIQPVSKPASENTVSNDAAAASLLSMLLLSVYAVQKSKKSMRKMKRRFLWTAFKLKMKSLFSKKRISDRVLIYILLGVIALVLVFYYPLIALLVAVIALILILAGVI